MKNIIKGSLVAMTIAFGVSTLATTDASANFWSNFKPKNILKNTKKAVSAGVKVAKVGVKVAKIGVKGATEVAKFAKDHRGEIVAGALTGLAVVKVGSKVLGAKGEIIGQAADLAKKGVKTADTVIPQ